MNKNIIIPALMMLDINEREATIVLEVLHTSEITITALAKKLKLSRTTLYKHIETLLAKKILEKAKNATTYHIKDREVIKSHISGNLILAEDETISLLQKNQREIPEIRITEGHAKIKTVYENIGTELKKGDVYYRYTSRKEDHKKSELYSELKKRKDLERLVITSEEKAGSKKHDSNRFIKTVPKNFAFDDNVSLIIYGNKIVHIDYKVGTAITITSKSLARFQEKIFKILWSKL
jgi:predicted transcriptional regulator